MRTFHYLPPAPEEQRAFALQLLGSVLALLALAFLLSRSANSMHSSVLWGCGAAVVFTLGQSAWSLEKLARRAQLAALEVSDEALTVTDAQGVQARIAWTDVQECRVHGGRLEIRWADGKLEVGAREIEDGMTFVREVAAKCSKSTGEFRPPTNFIPLDAG